MSKVSLTSLLLGGALGAGIAIAGSHLAHPTASPGEAASPVPAGEVAGHLQTLLAETDPLHRVSDLGALLPRLDPAEAPEIARVFGSSQLDSGDPELVLFAIWWAQHDPKAAFDWSSSDWRAKNATVISVIVRAWAHRDPKVALGAARGLVVVTQRDLATDAAISGWDESGQPGLFNAMREFNSIEFQQAAAAIARRRVIALWAEGALKWADSLEGPARDALLVRVASVAASDARGAPLVAEWARPRVSSGKEERLSGFPRRIGTRWVQHDPEHA